MYRKSVIKPLLLVALGSSALTVNATGVPTVDVANIAQTTITAMENVEQTLNQIKQIEYQINAYQTQLNQYKYQINQFDNMLQNTANPTRFIWDQTKDVMRNILQIQDQIGYYQREAGSLNNWLDQYQDANYYRSQPCFNGGLCSTNELNKVYEQRRISSTAQKNANDALFKAIEQQQKNLEFDSAQLERLQGGSMSADGQMKAIQYANQLASQQANQLLQIRSLLLAQQNAMAVRYQEELDLKAQQQAASEQFLGGKIGQPSPDRKW